MLLTSYCLLFFFLLRHFENMSVVEFFIFPFSLNKENYESKDFFISSNCKIKISTFVQIIQRIILKFEFRSATFIYVILNKLTRTKILAWKRLSQGVTGVRDKTCNCKSQVFFTMFSLSHTFIILGGSRSILQGNSCGWRTAFSLLQKCFVFFS